MTCALAAMVVVTVFSYSPRVSETDASPWVGTCGRVFAGSVAVSQDLFGRKGWSCGDVLVVNGQKFVVNDTMHVRHKKTVDIWQQDTSKAIRFGKRVGLACPGR